MTRGLLYVATGRQFLAEAIESVESLRKWMPDTPVAVATAPDLDVPDAFDIVVRLDNPRNGYADKISAMRATPFDRTISLDTDLYFDEAVGGAFRVLEEFQLAAAHSPNRTYLDLPEVPDAFPQHNTGFVAFRQTDAVLDFLDEWERNYERLQERGVSMDQPSFRRTLYRSDLAFTTLPSEYNTMVRFPGHAFGQVAVFHGHLVDTDDRTQYVDVPTVAAEINALDRHRVWTHADGFTVHSNATTESDPNED